MGKRRHLARRLSLQVLFSNKFLSVGPEAIMIALGETGEISKKNWTQFAKDLTTKTISDTEALDVHITKALQNWRLERLSVVDLLILRLALCEMRSFPDIPIRVTLNEYIELAKEFGTDDSASFVNGILDRLSEAYAEKDFQDDGKHDASTKDKA